MNRNLFLKGTTMRNLAAALATCVILVYSSTSNGQTSITASNPTHYFYTPAPYVNPPYHLVLSLHEISFALPSNLQLQASLFDNIGRINFGAKYGFAENLSLGGGLAHSLVHIGDKAHGIPSWAEPRLGAFLSWGFLMQSSLEAVLVPHTQIGDHFSIGADIGLVSKVHPVWSFIWELGMSIDATDDALYLNTDGGLRIHPPSLPFLNFDAGIDLEEFRVEHHPDVSATIYFDVIFSMVVK
jgi:hypothetical protein